MSPYLIIFWDYGFGFIQKWLTCLAQITAPTLKQIHTM